MIRKNVWPSKNISMKHLVTYVPGSPLFLIFCAASTIIPLLPKATFTKSIHPHHGLSRTRPPLLQSTLFSHMDSLVLIHSFHMPKPSQYSLIFKNLYFSSLRTSDTKNEFFFALCFFVKKKSFILRFFFFKLICLLKKIYIKKFN